MAELRVYTTTTGGDKIEKILKDAQQAERTGGVAIGFFASAKYEDGTPVAHVAHSHEYGLGVPERAFFRASVRKMETELLGTLRDDLDSEKMAVSEKLADKLGAQGAGIVQETISNVDYSPAPPLSPETIERKGSSTPLIDTGRMRQSVTWKTFK